MQWATAGFVSLAAHIAMFSLISLSVDPEPTPDQPVPKTRFNVQAYQVDRTKAQESAPDTQSAAAQSAKGASLGQDAIAVSRSKAATLQSTQLTPEPSAATPLDASSPALTAMRPAKTPALVQQAQTVTAPSVQATTLAPTALQQMPPSAATLLSQSPSVADVQPAALLATTLQQHAQPADVLTSQPPALAAIQPKALAATSVPQQVQAALNVASQVPAAAAIEPKTLAPIAVPQQPQTAVTVASKLPASTIIRSDTPATAHLQPETPAAVVTVQLRPSSQFLQTAAPQAQLVTAVAYRPVPVPDLNTKQTATELSPSRDQTTPAQNIEPRAQNLGQLENHPVQSAALILPAEKATAALAYSGGAGGEVDPISLAAIQSFMQPSDLSTSASSSGTVRDGISKLLSQVPCARLQVTFVPETGTLQVNGHIPDADLRAPVLAALRQQIGADIVLNENLLILPRPQCGALSGIANVGLAQSTDQITNPLLIGEDTHAREFQYTAGDRLILDLAAPDYDAFIYVDYFDAAGQVIHLSPNEVVALQATPAKNTLQIGAEKINGRSLNITIGPPYGQEIAVAFAASTPLYEGVRPTVEPAEPYLIWLKGRVAAIRETQENFKGEWVYFFVTTRAN